MGKTWHASRCAVIVIAMGVLAATAQGREKLSDNSQKDASGRMLAHLRLHGEIHESEGDLSLWTGQKNETMRQWLDRLEQAGRDKKIDAVALEVDGAHLSVSAAMELASAIHRLDATKPVYTFLTVGDLPQYLVASAGRKVFMEPTGQLSIVGLAIEMGFYRGTLDKWGLTPQFVQAGQYKGAAEPYMSTGPSEALRGEIDQLLDDLYGRICRAISENRNLSAKTVRRAINNGPLRAAAAKQYRLVDRLVCRQRWLAELAGLDRQHPTQVIDDYGQTKSAVVASNPLALLSVMIAGSKTQAVQNNTIAIITAEGVIVSGKSGTGLFGNSVVGHQSLVKAFAEARDEKKIKAVVLRINSPGGSAMASELIYQAVRDCARRKPVIVSITGLGASGGYYIAMGGDEIYAAPMAVVGSIGVVAGRVSFKGLLQSQRVATHAWTRGRNAGLNLSRPWTPRELQVIRREIDKTYLQFTSRVADARGDKIADIEAVAQGRIFEAERARKMGLVDRVGDLSDALAEASRRGKIEGSAHYLILPRPKTLMDLLSGDEQALSPVNEAASMTQALGRLAGRLAGSTELAHVEYLLEMSGILNRETMMLALPYHLELRY